MWTPASIDPTTVTVSRDPCGRWYVSFAVDVPNPEQLPATGSAVGVDLGINDFAVTSGGQRIANPRHLERRARNLARYQRRMARCQRGCANRAKARAKVARAHRKVRAARTDFLHKASTRLIRDHDVIVLEDLTVQNMVRNRTLAKAISDCGWGTFRAMIEYKAARYGRRVIVIDRWYPSSKTCSACGYLLATLGLDTRHLDVPVLRHPARPGHQRREEHPGGRSCRSRGQPRLLVRRSRRVTAAGAASRHSQTSSSPTRSLAQRIASSCSARAAPARTSGGGTAATSAGSAPGSVTGTAGSFVRVSRRMSSPDGASSIAMASTRLASSSARMSCPRRARCSSSERSAECGSHRPCTWSMLV